MANPLADIARRYFRAYEQGDRAFVENNLAPGFTFTSPYDDHIGRDDYFARCWPNHKALDKFRFDAVMTEGDRVMVLYQLEFGDVRFRKPNA